MLLLYIICLVGFFFYGIQKIDRLAREIQSKSNELALAECRLEAFNLVLYNAPLPVLIKVYLVGIVETLFIVICRRGLFKDTPTQKQNEKSVDELVNTFHGPFHKVAVMTGGDSGIGLEICRGLLIANFHVIIGTHSNCDTFLQALKSSTGSDKVSCIQLDLTSFESVHYFVNQIKKQVPFQEIQLLINNAGVMNIPFQSTKDGYESQSQINFISPFMLTQQLLPWMNKETGRVLFASSSTLYAINRLYTDSAKQSYQFNGLDHYAFSKSCVAHLSKQLAMSTNIKIYCYHPGTVRTKLFAHTTVFNLPLISKLFDFIMLSPKEGSKTPLYLCLADCPGQSGTYWANERVQTLPTVWINDKQDDRKSLWEYIKSANHIF